MFFTFEFPIKIQSYSVKTWIVSFDIDSFINLDQDLKKSLKILVKLRPVFELEKIWNGCRYLEALFLLWKFRIFVAIWSWFQANNLFGFEIRAFWKKIDQKTSFLGSRKRPTFQQFWIFCKNAWLCKIMVTAPIDLQQPTRYQ